MKKGDTVFYETKAAAVRARVTTVHRDGSVSVRALFFQRDGKDIPGYLGFICRLWPNDPQIVFRTKAEA
nr:MAG TPA: hypothetical protein [Caudoviricetes sp.]